MRRAKRSTLQKGCFYSLLLRRGVRLQVRETQWEQHRQRNFVSFCVDSSEYVGRRDRAYRNRGLHRDVYHLGRGVGDMTERRPPYEIIDGQSAEVRLTVDFRR